MDDNQKYIKTDLVVIGSGPGGYTEAFRAADLGINVILIEKNFGFTMQQLRGKLFDKGIETRAFFIGMHKQPAYKKDFDNFRKITLDKIKSLEKEIKSLGGKIADVNALPDNEKIKKLNKQLEEINIKIILEDKNKNQIRDKIVNDINIRFQLVKDFPSKELRSLVDQGKKDLKEGIVIVYTVIDKKVGIAVGITSGLTKKYDAVEVVKLGAKASGGIGGGGRKDFAQAGGKNSERVDFSFEEILKFIKKSQRQN